MTYLDLLFYWLNAHGLSNLSGYICELLGWDY
jgi:hypothetical protein